jgi:tetratricopeptide (TPR) repeat protein
MNIKRLSLCLCGLAGLTAVAQAQQDGSAAKLDPKRIINESMRFLKEREPDLTAEESALYENLTQQLAANPKVGLKLLEEITRPEAKDSVSPAFDLLLGNVYYASGARDKAEAWYRRAVTRYPTFLRAWTNLGLLHYAAGDYDRAIPCFAKSVTLGDRQSTTFGLMGYCFEKTGDLVAAEVAYMQALASDPDQVNWTEGLLRVYLAGKQYPRAEIMVRRLIKERPADASYWLTLADIMVASGRRLEAIALLEQALSVGAGGERERLELAGLYADEQMMTEAAELYRQVKATAQVLGERKALQLVRIWIGLAEWDRAQGLLEEMQSQVGAEGRNRYRQVQADLLAARGRWAEARRVLAELLNSEPMNGRALVSLGRTYLSDGDDAHARLAFESAMQTTDGIGPASLALANLELKQRHYDKSAAHLEKALELQLNRDLEEILARVRTLIPTAPRAGT